MEHEKERALAALNVIRVKRGKYPEKMPAVSRYCRECGTSDSGGFCLHGDGSRDYSMYQPLEAFDPGDPTATDWLAYYGWTPREDACGCFWCSWCESSIEADHEESCVHPRGMDPEEPLPARVASPEHQDQHWGTSFSQRMREVLEKLHVSPHAEILDLVELADALIRDLEHRPQGWSVTHANDVLRRAGHDPNIPAHAVWGICPSCLNTTGPVAIGKRCGAKPGCSGVVIRVAPNPTC